MKRLLVAALVVIFLAALHPVYGEKPHTIERLADRDLISIKTRVRFTTLIALPEGEEILEVTCGDKEFFVIEGRNSNVHVKPAKEGAVTNLHIVTKSGTVYSFLVEEISGPKGRPTKATPDLIVRVNPEDREQLKKDKDNLTEALSRAERELKAERERLAEAERKRLPTKDEPKPITKKDQEVPRAEAPLVGTQSAAATMPRATAPVKAAQTASTSDATFRVYAVVNNGIIERTGRAMGSALRRVGRFFRFF